jgi:putative CocE/NonD family hydrolase
MRCLILPLVVLATSALAAQPPQSPAAAEAVRARYQKFEYRIPMRDGVRLFTSVYVPRDTTRTYGILMSRTPYSVAPYGADTYRAALGPSSNPKYAAAGYIFVYQDVRGRNWSEGAFTEMTPHKPVKGPRDVDESTDSWDTVDWLVRNIPRHNGKVGIYGGSWPGFYATASCIDAHPALKACSPQAPMTDVYNGDDNFHNGAFLLAHNFGFFNRFGRGPRTGPGPDPQYPFRMGTNDAYEFYLNLGPVHEGALRHSSPETAPLLYEIMEHPDFDQHWKERNIRPHLRDMKPAILVVGGLFDTEDLFGPWGTWRAIEQLSPGNNATIVNGPWSHGGWGRGDANVLGNARFGAPTGPFFRDTVEFGFFDHYVGDGPRPDLPEALVFETGANAWRRYAAWPPPNAQKRSLVLQPGGKLVLAAAGPRTTGGAAATNRDPGYDAYVSDPARPVPVVDRIEPNGMPRDYIVGDQRFAARRPDVLVYQTEPLADDVTIAGPVAPVLHVATSGTDADFIVKLIDVYPSDHPNWPGDSSGFQVGGYQMLIRGEPFRGKFRRGFERPVPFVRNRPDSLRFEMPDINHTFRKGHRIMVQIQSTWFPHIDRNPQTFVPNIFKAKASDFRSATMRVYRGGARSTRLEVLVVPRVAQ